MTARGRMGTVEQPALPRNLAEAAEHEGRQAWLVTTLPAVIGEISRSWSLTVGAPFQPGGQTAWVAPVRDATGASLVLKVAWRHPEAAHETAGLRAWAGHGAVRLHAARDFDDAIALLIERCEPGLPLSGRPETEQDTVITGLLRAGNVLSAAREPWLVIDPKPYIGDPAYDLLQHMLNCGERLASDPRGLALRMAGLLDLDPGRVLLWLFARCVQESPDWPALAEVARRIAPA
jgi:streptomycin 6-kinase